MEINNSVSVVFWRKDKRQGDILVVRNHKKGGISLPGGRVENGESLVVAAYRELYEETGVIPDRMEMWSTIKHISDKDGKFWLNTVFLASNSDGKTPKLTKMEEATSPFWINWEELLGEHSLYPEWYRILWGLNAN